MSKLESIKDKFNEYIENFDWNEFGPFGHGTTKERSEKIKKTGLLTRKDCKRTSDNWKYCKASSNENNIYLETCNENYRVGIRSCENAYDKDHEAYKQWYPTSHSMYEGDFIEEQCKFAVIKDMNKYRDNIVLDEDAHGFTNLCMKAFYSDEGFKKGSCGEDQFKRLPTKLVDFLDLIFIFGGEKEVHDAIDKVPGMFSHADYGTIALNTSISPADFEILDTLEYGKKKYSKKCLENKNDRIITNERIEKIKPYKERDKERLKIQHYPHYKYFTVDSKIHRGDFKEWVIEHQDEYFKQIGL